MKYESLNEGKIQWNQNINKDGIKVENDKTWAYDESFGPILWNKLICFSNLTDES